MDGLTVGRIVHFVELDFGASEDRPGAHRAAIITALDNAGLVEPYISHPEVSLHIFLVRGDKYELSVPYDETASRPFTWHWIEKA